MQYMLWSVGVIAAVVHLTSILAGLHDVARATKVLPAIFLYLNVLMQRRAVSDWRRTFLVYTEAMYCSFAVGDLMLMNDTTVGSITGAVAFAAGHLFAALSVQTYPLKIRESRVITLVCICLFVYLLGTFYGATYFCGHTLWNSPMIEVFGAFYLAFPAVSMSRTYTLWKTTDAADVYYAGFCVFFAADLFIFVNMFCRWFEDTSYSAIEMTIYYAALFIIFFGIKKIMVTAPSQKIDTDVTI